MADLPTQSELVTVNKDDFSALLEACEWLFEEMGLVHYKCDLNDQIDCYAEQYGDGTAADHERLSGLQALLDRAERVLR